MDNSSYPLGTAQIGLVNKITVLANDIANANTPGYKSSEFVNIQKNVAEGNNQKLTLPIDYKTFRNASNGGIEVTGNDFDLAINGVGYFAITTPNGTRYTRNGGFHRSVAGTLVTSSGDSVQSVDGGELVIPNGSIMEVDQLGNVTVDQVPIGRLGIFEFPDEQLLHPVGDGHLMVSDANGILSTNFTVIQGALEKSNVNSIKTTHDLISTQRDAEGINNLIMLNESLNSSMLRKLGPK